MKCYTDEQIAGGQRRLQSGTPVADMVRKMGLLSRRSIVGRTSLQV